MTRETYLTYYLLQSCGWVKIAELACASNEDAKQAEADIRAQFPSDTVKFEVR
jgi:hypothetical protein